MKCEMSDRDQRIDDFLLEKLSPEDTEAFEIHLFGCSECLQELRLREQMVKLIKEERVTLVAAPVATRAPAQSVSWIRSLSDFFNLRPSGWIYVGAAAVLLVGFVITQIVRKTDHAEMYAANFIEPPQLESMLGQVQRSSAFAVSVLSPRLGENFEGDIVFRWNIQKDGKKFNEPVNLKILDNKETVVHSAKIERGEYILKRHLIPGLYYWTIEIQGEMLYLGKFFVNRPAQ